jgi:predicted dithiol-disulfide oxidoreductase (DUF899 family)
MTVRFPNETDDYRAAREALLEREAALRREMEDVAAARRALPPGGEVPEDYAFAGPDGPVRLSELFGEHDTLAIYSMMFPRDPEDDRPGRPDGACPSCTALLDQLDGMVPHTDPHMAFAVAAHAPVTELTTFAAARGWRRLRLVSHAGTTYNRDYHGQTEDGRQRPMLNVFVKRDGAVRHFWGSELLWGRYEPDMETRHVGTLEPMWNLFDMTPRGRGDDWEEQLNYGCC